MPRLFGGATPTQTQIPIRWPNVGNYRMPSPFGAQRASTSGYPLMMEDTYGPPAQEDLSPYPGQGIGVEPPPAQTTDWAYNPGTPGPLPTGAYPGAGSGGADQSSGWGGRLSTLLGLAGAALAPNTPGGRLGGVMGSLGMQRDAEEQRMGLFDRIERQKQAQAAERERRLNAAFAELTPQPSRLSLQETPLDADPGRVGMTVSARETPSFAPTVQPRHAATFFQALPKEGAAAVMDMYRNTNQAPTEASATTERMLALAHDDRLRNLVPPNAWWNVKGGKEGFGFSTEQPHESSVVAGIKLLEEHIRAGTATPAEQAMWDQLHPEKSVNERPFGVGPLVKVWDPVQRKFVAENTNMPPAAQGVFASPPDAVIREKGTGRAIGQNPSPSPKSLSPQAEAMVPYYTEKIGALVGNIGQPIPGSGVGGSNWWRTTGSAKQVADEVATMLLMAKTDDEKAAITRAWELAGGGQTATSTPFARRRAEIEAGAARGGAASTRDPLEGRTASGPNGPMIRRNGQWVPYNGR